MKRIRILAALFLILAGCHSQNNKSENYAFADLPSSDYLTTPADKVSDAPETNLITSDKKIIRNGSMGIETDNLGESKAFIDSLVKKYSAYYTEENLQNTDYSNSYSLTIRIPFRYFDIFIQKIEEGSGEITYKNIEAKDVTEEYIDLETRLQNKRNYLKRYNELLAKAKNVNEILEIEEKIRVIEEEIESSQGKLNYLLNQTSYSTLVLTLSKEIRYRFKPSRRIDFGERLKKSLSGGWFGFVDLLLFLIRLWPLWIILAAIVPFWRKYKRNRKAKP